jgi:hypothetical protein
MENCVSQLLYSYYTQHGNFRNDSNEDGGQEKDFFEVLVFRSNTKTSTPPYIRVWGRTSV